MKSAVGICYTIGIGALPVAIWRGDFPQAHRLIAMLLEYSGKYGLRFWQSWARLHQRAVSSHEEARGESVFLPSEIQESALTAI